MVCYQPIDRLERLAKEAAIACEAKIAAVVRDAVSPEIPVRA